MKSKINSFYRIKESNERFHQEDLFSNVMVPYYNNENLLLLNFPYVFILSQDCDLEGDFSTRSTYDDSLDVDNKRRYHNKFISSILVCPAFIGDDVKEGNYLSEIYDDEKFFMHQFNSKDFKQIKQNQNPRYYYIKEFEEFSVPDLCLDFKQYYAIPRNYFYSLKGASYVASLEELFREHLSQRFFLIFNPELDFHLFN